MIILPNGHTLIDRKHVLDLTLVSHNFIIYLTMRLKTPLPVIKNSAYAPGRSIELIVYAL